MRNLLFVLAAVSWGVTFVGCRGTGKTGTSPGASDPPRVTINGRVWFVEPATTSDQRYRGLGGRQHLDPNGGMLFIYPKPRVLDFCMRGCLVPLDIAFIDADMRVVKTYTMSTEADLSGRAVYSSDVPVQYALEVAAGALAEAGVRPGDRAALQGVPEAAKAEDGP
jgi:hypothetical protein